MTASEYVQTVLPLGGKANPLSLLINIFTLTARRSVAWPPSPKRKITSKTQRYHLSGALGPPRRSKNKVKGPQEEDKQPTCRRTGAHVYTRHRRSHVCTHPCRFTLGNTHVHGLNRAHKPIHVHNGHTCVRAQPPACLWDTQEARVHLSTGAPARACLRL